MNARLLILSAQELSAHQPALREFERGFSYPLGDEQSFYIDHGSRYAAFFEAMGEPLFALLFDGEKIIGILAAIRKHIKVGGHKKSAVYYGDLKIHPDYQRKGLTTLLSSAFLKHWLATPYGWLACHYGISMQQEKRDTFHNLKSRWLMRRFGVLSSQQVFFATPHQLANINVSGVEEEDSVRDGVDLSPQVGGLIVSTAGKKDLVISGSSTVLNFAHFAGHSLVGERFVKALREAGTQSVGTYEQICFSVDSRRAALLSRLATSKIIPSGAASVRALPSLLSITHPSCVFVSTSEI